MTSINRDALVVWPGERPCYTSGQCSAGPVEWAQWRTWFLELPSYERSRSTNFLKSIASIDLSCVWFAQLLLCALHVYIACCLIGWYRSTDQEVEYISVPVVDKKAPRGFQYVKQPILYPHRIMSFLFDEANLQISPVAFCGYIRLHCLGVWATVRTAFLHAIALVTWVSKTIALYIYIYTDSLMGAQVKKQCLDIFKVLIFIFAK